jgi:flagellar biosynthesis/type III secretory pathway protein FliH
VLDLSGGDALAALIADCERMAHERGREQGRQEALNDAAGLLERAAAQLERARDEAAARLAHTCTRLSVEIARLLLGRELRAGNLDIERLVRDCLAASGVGRGACVVHVHPEDARALEEIRFRSGTTIEADSGVARGSVHISTPHGLLVRDHEDALKAMAAALEEALE